MASSIHEVTGILDEFLVVLDATQVAIDIDANSEKNLPILKKYLASTIIPISGISKAMGKPGDEQSVNDNDCIEDQCYELLDTVINHICYIMYQLKNEKCLFIINQVEQKVLKKLKLYLNVSEVYGFFKDEDISN